MATAAEGRTPVHLWIVGILSLLWNAFGAYDYVMTELHNQAYLSNYPADVVAYVESAPAWMVGVWAVGVWVAVLGSILLLIRSRHAVTAFAVSLLAVAVTSIYQYALSSAPASMKSGFMLAMMVLVWAIAIFQLWYSWAMDKRGVLR